LFLFYPEGREHSDVGLEGYRYASLATATARPKIFFSPTVAESAMRAAVVNFVATWTGASHQ